MEESSTKEKILESALSFYSGFVNENISLNKIATKVGITKAAIFKHFKNKDELVLALSDRVFCEIADVLSKMSKFYEDGHADEALYCVISYLVSHRESVFFVISNYPAITEDAVIQELRKRGVHIFDYMFSDNGIITDKKKYFSSIYVSTSLFCFLFSWFKTEDEGFVANGDELVFIKKFDSFLSDGYRAISPVTDLFRFAELDEICRNQIETTPPVNRMFSALSSVIRKNGIIGITMDSIAEELGMAKSSLYSSFKNKEYMVKSLITEEVRNLFDAIIRSVSPLEKQGEKIYAMLESIVVYCIARPDILMVLQTIFFSRSDFVFDNECENTGSEDLYFIELEKQNMIPALPDIGLPNICDRIVLGWLCSLPSMLYLHCKEHNFSNDVIQAAVKDIYFMVVFGLRDKKESIKKE